MSHTFTRQQTLEAETCCACFMVFAMTGEFRARRRNDHKTFYCPAGHPQGYTGPTEEDKLRKQLEREQRWRANSEEDLRIERVAHSSTKGRLTKAKKRADNGVCQHCHRTFQNVARHMASQHPADGDA